MPSITFELETVTPLFLAGADQTAAELRPPAFRGALRYWFRALIGGYYWDNSTLQKLREVESSLLGDTNTYGSSKIILRIINTPEFKPLPVPMIQDRQRKKDGSGIGYLFFSMDMQNRKAIGVNQAVKFSLKISTRLNPNISKEEAEKNLLIAVNCFWFAIILGGIGSRERRGAGSLRVIEIQSQDIENQQLPLFILNKNQDILSQSLKNQIQKARINLFQTLEIDLANLSKITQLPDLETFNKQTMAIYLINDKFDSWREALDFIGQQYGNFRSEEIPKIRKRAVFGLPLKPVDEINRRSSPFRIKIIKSLDGFYILLMRLMASFPPNQTNQNVNIQPSSFKVIDEFINSFEYIERIF